MTTASNSSSTSDSSNPPSVTTRNFTLFNSSSQNVTVKLERDNYLVWESVVLPLIEGNRLQKHINGTAIIPPKSVTSANGVVENPEYEDWYALDRLLLGWLRNAMSQDIQAQLLHCKSAYDLWIGAKELTSASSRARVMLLKTQIGSIEKGGMKMEEFLGRMKGISDQLTMAGAPISSTDLVMYTCKGLTGEYNPIVAPLMGRDVSWIECQTSLLAWESHLEQQNKLASLSILPEAHIAQRTTSESRSSYPASRGDFGYTNRGPWRGGSRGSRGRRGRGRNTGGENKSYCDLCEKVGHHVRNCFRRYDRSFKPPSDSNRSFNA